MTLPYGDHEIELAALDSPQRTERASTAIVHVNSSTVVMNNTLGRRYSPGGQAAGILFETLGAMGLVVAIVVSADHWNNGTPGDGEGSAIAWGAALGLLGLGVGFLAAYPTIEQPGATREWTPPARVAGSSLGLKF